MATGLKNTNPDLKVLLAVGGWNEGSVKYSQMAANRNHRDTFVCWFKTFEQTILQRLILDLFNQCFPSWISMVLMVWYLIGRHQGKGEDQGGPTIDFFRSRT